MSFTLKSGFSEQNEFKQVVYTDNKPLLDVELNEMQEIQNYHRKKIMSVLYKNGVVGEPDFSLVTGTFHVKNTNVILNGEIVKISALSLPVVNGDSVYLEMWEEEVSHLDVIRKGGNQQEKETVPNAILDKRVNMETTRRIQTKYTLSKTNTNPARSYLKLATITGGKIVQETESLASIDEITRLFNAHAINSAIHVTTTQTNRWDAKETPENAQIKADLAKDSAINWAKSFGLGDVAKDISNTDLNTLDATGFYKGTNFTNGPVATTLTFIIQLKHTATIKNQIAIVAGTTPRMFIRYNSSGSWGAWMEYETTSGSQAKATAIQDWAKSFGLGSIGKNVSGTNINLLNETGFYVGTNLTNAPTLNGFFIIHEKWSDDSKLQKAVDLTTGAVYTRKMSVNVWSSWQELETVAGSQAKVNVHEAKKDNPHGVTKTQVGLGNVDNVKQASKAEFDTHNNNADIHVTSNQKNLWDAKETTSGSQAKADKALADAKLYAMNMVATNSTADPNTTQESYILTNHANAPATGYWHILTLFYSSRTGNRGQIAISYNQTGAKMYIRHIYGTTWTAWTEIEDVAGSQAKVDAHANLKNNPHAVTKAQVGLGSVLDYGLATQAEAEAGSSNAKYMTPQRTKEAILKLAPTPSTTSLTVTDAGDYYTATHVEGVLQEIGSALVGVGGKLTNAVNGILGG